MRVWTIQSPLVLESLRNGAIWRADEKHVDRHWRAAYRWMAGELAARCGPPVRQRQSPVWAWVRWQGIRRPRPDLRARGHLPAGMAGVRLELDIDPARILPSDFDLWHYALNGWYLPESQADERACDARPDPARTRQSWRRIFDLEWSDPHYTAQVAEKSVQAVLWELRPEDLRAVTPFQSVARRL